MQQERGKEHVAQDYPHEASGWFQQQGSGDLCTSSPIDENRDGAASPRAFRRTCTVSLCSSSIVSDDIDSVEEKNPVNAESTMTRALFLHSTSAKLLRAYHHTKHTVRQQTYRRYYMRWLRFYGQRLSRSTSTQTHWCDARSVSCLMDTLTVGNTQVGCGKDYSMQLPPYSFDLCNDKETSAAPTVRNALCDLQANYEGHDKTLSLPSDMPAVDPSGHGAQLVPSLLPRSLQSRSRPTLLQDYGHPSQPPTRPPAQIEDFPLNVPPQLLCFGANVTLHPQTAVSVKKDSTAFYHH